MHNQIKRSSPEKCTNQLILMETTWTYKLTGRPWLQFLTDNKSFNLFDFFGPVKYYSVTASDRMSGNI